jgi:hypothetical protein
LAALSPSPFWPGYITNMSGYNFRKEQPLKRARTMKACLNGGIKWPSPNPTKTKAKFPATASLNWIIIREGDRTRSLTKLDAVILTMVNAALKGDAKAQASLITMMRSLGLIGEPPQATNQEPFTPDDAALIEQYFRRHQGKSQPPDSEAKEDSSPSSTTPPERGTAS